MKKEEVQSWSESKITSFEESGIGDVGEYWQDRNFEESVDILYHYNI